MLLHILIIFIFLLLIKSCQTNLDGETQAIIENLKQKSENLVSNFNKKSQLPNKVLRHGKLGENYNLDSNNKPFIWCEQFNFQECPNETECSKSVKCYPESLNHRLGCMAVYIYNSSTTNGNLLNDTTTDGLIENYTVSMKGCWSQDEHQFKECLSEKECIINKRNIGQQTRKAKFCCCTTNKCNQNLIHNSAIDTITESTEPDLPEQQQQPFFSLLEAILSIGLIIFLFLCACLACGILFFMLRGKLTKSGKKFHDSKNNLSKIDEKSENLKRLMDPNEEAKYITTIDGNLVNLKEAKIVTRISGGRFGTVYKAYIENMAVAVKIFPNEDTDSWINEYDIYSIPALRGHPNIAQYMSSFPNNNQLWLITLFYENGSLYSYLKAHTIDLKMAAKFASSMLNGLAFLHEEIIHGTGIKPAIAHRDFKSKNILIKNDLTACIADFGLALNCDNRKIGVDESHTQVGTRRYMSPELLEGAMEFSNFAFQQIDVYAAGLVLWEILSRCILSGMENDPVENFLLPYEKEVGPTPSLGDMREIVIIKAFRPTIKPIFYQNEFTNLLIKTMSEMWESEPDCRITSGCARDRLQRINKVLVENLPTAENGGGANYQTTFELLAKNLMESR